ncbi:Ribosome protection-type tetracycline resistance related protein, group 2 [Lachnospiraceae bacterium TWA4]|nr:Ribosome protection-type tetracycline resistance related protein, group 2 [Lachnospiraceae bacterium TWA4]
MILFLDTSELEKSRGITIFSKQAVFEFGRSEFTLLDTPGHVDFSTEMERTLSVLNYAILVISGADGVEAHTKTLWRLLKEYKIPTFIFVNKMDQISADKEKLMNELRKTLDDNCIDFTDSTSEEFYENISVCAEYALEEYLEYGTLRVDTVGECVARRQAFPCYFGSALKGEGVREFLEGFDRFLIKTKYGSDFGARVFKITRDEMGNRLTHLKVLGGSLKAKDVIGEEKVNQIRIYSGDKFESVLEVYDGQVCAVTGLNDTYAGQGLGKIKDFEKPLLEPILNYKVLLPRDCAPISFLPKIRQLEEEDPTLHVVWKEEIQEIQVQLMGVVQIEILKNIILERFGIPVNFAEGSIVYKETIVNTVEGVGHYEPLRHYAEVHVLLEPNRRGAGVEIDADCSEDFLDKNWQRLILTHLKEREYTGVLTGSAITDIKITLVSGKAHLKHTEGGDFRQATYRAVQQGLMQAQSILLEPYYEFELEIPDSLVGRAMMDLEKMKANFEAPAIENGRAILTGTCPVILMQGYQKDVTGYSKGEGSLTLRVSGYDRCHNEEEVLENTYYDAEANPYSGSIFCTHGAGFFVPWYEVFNYMHLPLKNYRLVRVSDVGSIAPVRSTYTDEWIDSEEVDAILNHTLSANKKQKERPVKNKKVIVASEYKPAKNVTPKDEYLLVDGYNIIFAWKELADLAATNIDAARQKLQDILSNYQGIRKCQLILVFDAYRVQGHQTEILDYHNIHVVYTKEAETADQYIEKFAHEKGRTYKVTVATSDGLEQIIIRGQGCFLLSAREFEKEVTNATAQLRREHLEATPSKKHYLIDELSEEEKKHLKSIDNKKV